MAQQPPHAVTSVSKTVGRTPLVRLARLERDGGPRLYAKCEQLGASGSIFDRAAVAELASADRAGHLDPSRPVVAAGGTDASISLAMAAGAFGVPLTVLVPRSLPPARRRMLLELGARLEELDDATGHAGAQDLAFERAGQLGGLYCDLFDGETVLQAYAAIGVEVVEAIGAAPTFTVCGLDLGAIPSGVARGLGGGAVVAVEPQAARIASQGTFAAHLMNGLAPGPEPVALDRTRVTRFESVSDDEAWRTSDLLARRTGVLGGLVSGAVVAAAQRLAEALGSDDAVVAVLPDAADRRFMLDRFFT